MASSKQSILVYSDWSGMDTPQLMGTLQAELLQGREIFSFGYDPNWLAISHAQVLDLDLQLYGGKQFIRNPAKSNFGIFMDFSPDRWVRVLMRGGKPQAGVDMGEALAQKFSSHHHTFLTKRFDRNPDGSRIHFAYAMKHPVETGTGLKLNISENDNALNLNMTVEVIPFFRMKKERAVTILNEVKNAVREWKTIAKELKIPIQQIESKTRAFDQAFT